VADILVATSDFTARVGGVDYAVRAGNTIESDHPLVRAHPEYFVPSASRVTFPTPRPAVEAATKAPGEKRAR
jgi:hypothetical protein